KAFLIPPGFVVALALWLAMLAPGYGATAAQRVQTAEQGLNTAQTKFNQARQSWDKAQQELVKAESAQQSASNRVHQARQVASQKHASELGMTAAIAERDAALHQINARRSAIDVDLKRQSAFQEAAKQSEAARHRLSEIPEDKSLNEEQQTKLSSALAAQIRR